jgi:hypothetical protein
MPKYFFHVYHNEPEIDYEGEELPDKHAHTGEGDHAVRRMETT